MFRYVDHQTNSTGYPPYNIVRNDNQFQIEMALAGVQEKDLDIEVAEGVLTVAHEPAELDDESIGEFVHRGIAQRKFKRNFTLSDDIVVKGAKFENGMLYINLERVIPEEKKPRKIAINKK
jgi:molecular chaperone IbpA